MKVIFKCIPRTLSFQSVPQLTIGKPYGNSHCRICKALFETKKKQGEGKLEQSGRELKWQLKPRIVKNGIRTEK